MGCDIHAHIEIKGPDNKWYKADPFVPNLFEKGKFVQGTELPIDRNYELFSLLEDGHVRNYMHTKGIAPARGIAEDSAFKDDPVFNGSDPDYWGQSYLNFKEIFDFAGKHPYVHMHGYMSKENYEYLKSGKITCPDMWWLDGTDDAKQYYAEWTMMSPLLQLANQLHLIEKLYRDQLYSNYGDQKVLDTIYYLDYRMRLVFAFDN